MFSVTPAVLPPVFFPRARERQNTGGKTAGVTRPLRRCRNSWGRRFRLPTVIFHLQPQLAGFARVDALTASQGPRPRRLVNSEQTAMNQFDILSAHRRHRIQQVARAKQGHSPERGTPAAAQSVTEIRRVKGTGRLSRQSLLCADQDTVCMKSARTFFATASWTHKLESEDKEEHDFNNLLLEFRYAVERQDCTFAECGERELRRMYRARRPLRDRQ